MGPRQTTAQSASPPPLSPHSLSLKSLFRMLNMQHDDGGVAVEEARLQISAWPIGAQVFRDCEHDCTVCCCDRVE